MNRLMQWFVSPSKKAGLRPTRWVVFDFETSGLDAGQDVILSIGAIAIVDGEVAVDDSFQAVVRPTEVSRNGNIEIHGITGDIQMGGIPLAEALMAFHQWRDQAPVAGWHIGFDMAFLKRTYLQLKQSMPEMDTLDVATLARVMVGNDTGDLEEMAERFGILCFQRHNACADALMTALVLSVLVDKAKRDGVVGYYALRSLARQSQWVL